MQLLRFLVNSHIFSTDEKTKEYSSLVT